MRDGQRDLSPARPPIPAGGTDARPSERPSTQHSYEVVDAASPKDDAEVPSQAQGWHDATLVLSDGTESDSLSVPSVLPSQEILPLLPVDGAADQDAESNECLEPECDGLSGSPSGAIKAPSSASSDQIENPFVAGLTETATSAVPRKPAPREKRKVQFRFDNLEFDLGEYYALNDAIFEHFFNPTRASHAVTLCLDDHEADEIAKELGLTTERFLERLFFVIRTLARSATNARDRFAWWHEREPRECAALLGTSVLIMSRQGVDEHGQLQNTGYYQNYNKTVLRRNSVATPDGFYYQSFLWRRLAEYLNTELEGRLGHLVFLQVLGYEHLNYPASQCFVRASDRKKLWELFTRYCRRADDLTLERFMRIIVHVNNGLSVAFLRAVNALPQHSDFAKAFWGIIDAEYSAWRESPEVQLQRQISRAAQLRSPAEPREARGNRPSFAKSNGLTAVEKLRNAMPVVNIPRTAEFVHETSSTARVPVTKTNVKSRLILSEAPGGADLYVQALLENGDNVSIPDLLPNAMLTATDLERGFRREFDGKVIHRGPSNATCFSLHENGLWVETQRTPSGSQRLCVLYTIDGAGDIEAFVHAVDPGVENIPLSARLSGCAALSFEGALSDIPDDRVAPTLADVLSVPLNRPYLTSGLPLGGRKYLEGAPPVVCLPNEESIFEEVLIDGKAVGRVSFDAPLQLPPDLSVAKHIVRIREHELEFDIVSADEALDRRDLYANGLGYVVARHPPLLHSDLHAEDYKTATLARMNAVVVVGADLLLPYVRTAGAAGL